MFLSYTYLRCRKLMRTPFLSCEQECWGWMVDPFSAHQKPVLILEYVWNSFLNSYSILPSQTLEREEATV
jgi:hypothetical protein